jgi:hypothetical protein
LVRNPVPEGQFFPVFIKNLPTALDAVFTYRLFVSYWLQDTSIQWEQEKPWGNKWAMLNCIPKPVSTPKPTNGGAHQRLCVCLRYRDEQAGDVCAYENDGGAYALFQAKVGLLDKHVSNWKMCYPHPVGPDVGCSQMQFIRVDGQDRSMYSFAFTFGPAECECVLTKESYGCDAVLSNGYEFCDEVNWVVGFRGVPSEYDNVKTEFMFWSAG